MSLADLVKTFREKTTDVSLVQTPDKPRGVYLVVVNKKPEEQSYEELAASVGFEPRGLTVLKVRREVETFFAANEIPIFDHEQVKDYLDRKVKKLQVKWKWVPLRKHDRDPSRYNIYERLVPKEILQRVKLIHDQFGDQAKFYVTDYEAINPDPFIKTVIDGVGFIFGVWDEPGLTIKK